MNWTPQQLSSYQARRMARSDNGGDSPAKESVLHGLILEECRRLGWLPFHGSMAHKTHRTPGEPDIICAASDGRTFWIELKTKQGKLTIEQAAIHAWLKKLGHRAIVVRSLAEFIQAVNEPS